MNHKTFSRASDGVRFAIRQWPIGRRLVLHLGGFLVAVALLAYLGPFGTWDELGVFDRLAFWAIAVGVNWLCAYFVFRVTLQAFFARRWPPWVGVALASAVSAVPGTGAVWGAVAAYLGHQPSGVAEVMGLYFQVAVLQLAIGALVFYLIEWSFHLHEAAARSAPASGGPASPTEVAEVSGGAGSAAQAEAPDAPAPAGTLVARLSERTRGKPLHLRMQDHYIEVHTSRGMEMVLLRFRDALREVEGVDGMQVHRSHWVARAAVDGVERRGGRVTLRLVNGTRVPVSRSFAPALRARGWI